MLRVAICDDSRRDVERLESALERLEHYHIQWDVFYSGEELICQTAHCGRHKPHFDFGDFASSIVQSCR